MEMYLKYFGFHILAPIIYMTLFAYSLTLTSLGLAKAWKSKNFKQIWLNIWLLLVTFYFLSLVR